MMDNAKSFAITYLLQSNNLIIICRVALSDCYTTEPWYMDKIVCNDCCADAWFLYLPVLRT